MKMTKFQIERTLTLFTIFTTGADIDTLCVFPRHVERDHFFTIMYNMLNERPEVSELTVQYYARENFVSVYIRGY